MWRDAAPVSPRTGRRADADQRDADLHGGEKFSRIGSQRERAAGTGNALGDKAGQPRRPGGDDGQLRHREQAIDDDQDRDDPEFQIEHDSALLFRLAPAGSNPLDGDCRRICHNDVYQTYAIFGRVQMATGCSMPRTTQAGFSTRCMKSASSRALALGARPLHQMAGHQRAAEFAGEDRVGSTWCHFSPRIRAGSNRYRRARPGHSAVDAELDRWLAAMFSALAISNSRHRASRSCPQPYCRCRTPGAERRHHRVFVDVMAENLALHPLMEAPERADLQVGLRLSE